MKEGTHNRMKPSRKKCSFEVSKLTHRSLSWIEVFFFLSFTLQYLFQHRYIPSNQPPEVPCYNVYNSLPPAGLEEPNQVELLLMENDRLRQELEAHREKTCRIQKV